MSGSTVTGRSITSRSGELYGRARELLPGGVNSPVRAMTAIGREPIFIERGSGARIWDADGNEYIDWVSSWGPLILGHAQPAVVAAVSEAAARGTSFGAPTEARRSELAWEVSRADPVCGNDAHDLLAAPRRR